ncbi:U-scoloptoxin(19)-Sm1a [Pectinophora gossypiella]|uniref:U-scoloptoxin(19)-Sm1a n=1 Tax=Pectinophora gossypiella TaxID=13191 RepID=UPI00214EC8D9|nr:U-scoloptoxin(19)-Sm1a [Pectinophora gossypiella]
MFWLTVLCLALVGSVITNSVSGYSVNSGEPFNELPCTTQGGICVRAFDCPEGKLDRVKGLCPLQQRNNVECCHGVALSETRCRKNGGECMPATSRCPDSLVFQRATDCEKDHKCCILI